MQSFESFLASLGLRPQQIIPGRWMRCPTDTKPRKRNGSYKLSSDGQIGWAMDFTIHTEPAVWRPERQEAPRIDRAAIARRLAAERRALEAATRAAVSFYESCAPLIGGHPYLDSKWLSMEGCSGLKRHPKTGALVVPMRRAGAIASLQSITASGEKRFWPGASVRAAQYLIDRPGAALTILCEGLATGLTLFAAVPTARVVIAFNSGNLRPVAATLGPGLRVVAADNDHATASRIGRNPGLDAAQAAAAQIDCGVAAPECEGTDWNDFFCERLEQLRASERHARRRRTEAQLVLTVNAQIRAAVLREARFNGG